jgi:hypothetical protein
MARRRSIEIALLTIGAGVFVGYPLVRDMTSEPVQRNRYVDRRSCECDYPAGCSYVDRAWVGPWYTRAEDRNRATPASGACRANYLAGRYASGREGAGNDSYRAPTIEQGRRGGFGSTGRVRSAGS